MDAVRALCTSALGELSGGRVDEALKLGEEALELMLYVDPRFGCDERALDALLGLGSLALELGKEGTAAQASRARTLLHSTLRLRLRALVGEAA